MSRLSGAQRRKRARHRRQREMACRWVSQRVHSQRGWFDEFYQEMIAGGAPVRKKLPDGSVGEWN